MNLSGILALDIWKVEYFGNAVGDFAVAAIAFIAFLVLFKVFQQIIILKLKRIAKSTKTDIDDTMVQIIQTLRPPFYSFLAFYFALNFIALHGGIRKVLTAILIVWVVYQAISAAQLVIDYALYKASGREESPTTRSAMKSISAVTKGILWAIGGLFILSNLGVNVTSFIAGLGIGGIAIALALQNILSDLFSSFAIYFDKPFAVGDYIVVGEKSGTVERIGIKTTRIRALQGEEIVMSNQDLTTAIIQNFKKLQERRVTFQFGLTYDTPTEKLKKVSGMVKEIIETEKLARFDRANFKTFDDSALTFDVVYYITSPEYAKYMETQQNINIKIMERFETEKLSMAFPTRTIYIEKD